MVPPWDHAQHRAHQEVRLGELRIEGQKFTRFLKRLLSALRLHATLQTPRDFAMVGQERIVEALRRDPCADDLNDWLEYHRLRYGW